MKKKIIITGSSGQIGKKICKFFSKKFQIIKVDKKFGIDLCKKDHVIKLFKQNRNAEYLINLHGYDDPVTNKIKKTEADEETEFLNYFLNNVYSIYLTNKYFKKICKRGKGIINFASLYAIISPKHQIYRKPKNPFYIASKFSVVGLTKYYASLFGKNLNINCIVNGGIEANQPKDFKKKLSDFIPKKRMMRSSDLFGILELLCSEKSNYINGSTIIIDGGYTC